MEIAIVVLMVMTGIFKVEWFIKMWQIIIWQWDYHQGRNIMGMQIQFNRIKKIRRSNKYQEMSI